MSNDTRFNWTWTCNECGKQDTEKDSPRQENFDEVCSRLNLRSSSPSNWMTLWCRACSRLTDAEVAAARVARALAP